MEHHEEKVEPKLFTQEEVGELFEQRLARERKADLTMDDIRAEAEEFAQRVGESDTQSEQSIDILQAKAKELDELKARMAEQELQSKFKQAGVTNFDKLRPFLNPEKFDGDSLDELVAVLSELKPKPVKIGYPTNGSPANESKVYEAQLQDAAAVAKQSGRSEDIVRYSALKQTLKKFGGK
ncbi:hypothetical protein [Lysinibacillus fusiformis]|uniref:hypothetical protein n=1 Tax=Lysinibacillus fusiformis TaxID=28031 RepID=UPI000D395806|nr:MULTISPECIES: hypothetical protein [Lysinibacillus]MED4672103.1 hypothetical protein [Lysinibacillus fusiformis]QAS57420.1 hypothetical protein LSP_14220 [Lysinibacillus sphaericus]RDV26983.1 hypothetical protein C7B90_19990 [Lysinibacillus fusiformis]GED65137.1 hypothetical protein LFU01_35890 [Lysinibacillus fusiformis]